MEASIRQLTDSKQALEYLEPKVPQNVWSGAYQRVYGAVSDGSRSSLYQEYWQ